MKSRDEVVKRACCDRPCGFGPVGKAFSRFGSSVEVAQRKWSWRLKWLIRDLRWQREEEKDTKEAAVEGEVIQMQLTVTFEVGCWGGG